ncbi:tRNA pseudouridine(38-40) synthase TruA [Salinisphaera sp. T31B1]|uniref:tRNA pseudouridine(38-40) synthase TruA n=1 Tax=Salinisphaera sp. T31B1 TaxID=727963 RepID=UPI00333F92D5
MRWAACIEYDGSGYHGWQSQPHAASVQDTLETALSRLADAPIRTVCSGRTDAGVHAQGQIVHFDTQAVRRQRAWLLGTNRYLPDDIAVQWVEPVDESFHARFGAVAREYRYWILDRTAPSALWRNRAYHSHVRLDAEAMHAAAQQLVGYHDFSAFRAAACQAKTPWRDLQAISVVRHGDWLRLDVRANAFLHHMVRNIVGSLLPIGRGQHDDQWLADRLAEGDRTQAGMTAPAQGLSLRRVHYPPRFVLPQPALERHGW